MNHAVSLSPSLTKITLERLVLGIASVGLLSLWLWGGSSIVPITAIDEPILRSLSVTDVSP